MILKNKKIILIVFRFSLYLFALIGLIFVVVFLAMQFNLLNVPGSVSKRNSYFNFNKGENKIEPIFQKETLVWVNTDEWNLMKEVFVRDQEIIKKAGRDAGISPRLIIGCVIGEQFRFFSSRRESFKGYFEPLKILASLSKISYGIAGIKLKTAGLIEEHLKDSSSIFYLGPTMENILDYRVGADISKEQMERITNVNNPYYPYLYVGLYLRQVEAQWSKNGYDISDRPEVLATLYNLGFPRSIPKPNPKGGGAIIKIGDIDYTFGDLGYEFYYSEELNDIFPQ